MRVPADPRTRTDVLARRQAYLQARIAPRAIAAPLPVHGAGVARVTGSEPLVSGHALFADVDALVTAVPDVALTITAADCLPIYLIHDQGAAIGLAHAGWKGLVAGVIQATVDALSALGAPPAALRAAIGPSVGPCHYAVDAARRALFAERFGPEAVHGEALDLRAAARIALARTGVALAVDMPEPPCTACQAERFFSHRIDRSDPPTTGMAWIALGR